MSLISRKLLKARPQELGKIKIGGVGEERQSTGGRKWRLPVKFDHFRVVGRDRGPDGNYIVDEAIHERVGDKPTELEGNLMFETPEENFHAEMVQYQRKTKIVSCDGEERTNLKSGDVQPCPRVTSGECACKPYSRLHLQLWADPVGFYRVFRTTSWESTNNIQSALEDYYERFGTLYHLPVKLIIYPAEVRYEDNDGEARTSQSYMVGLVLSASMEDVTKHLVEKGRRLAATKAEIKRLSGEVLSEQQERDREDEADIAEEYFPRKNVEASVKTQETLDEMKEELQGAVEGEDFEIVEDDEGEAEAGSDQGASERPPEATETAPPAEAEPASTKGDPDPPEIRKLKEDLAAAMEKNAPELLTNKESRRKWTHRQIGKASPRTATEFELRQLVEAVEKGDTDPEAPAAEEEAEAVATPFDGDEGQEEMPV